MKKFLSLFGISTIILLPAFSCTKTNNSSQADPILEDTSSTQFVIFTFGNSTSAYLRPLDTIDARHYINVPETEIAAYSTISSGNISFKFSGNASLGIKPITALYLRQGNKKYGGYGNLNVNILQFANAKNGYIIGSFSGVVKDSFASFCYLPNKL